MPENKKIYMDGIILIDKYGNRYCDLDRYQEAVICIVYDASSIIDSNVQNFSNSKNPDTLPTSNGIFIPIKDESRELLWNDVTRVLDVLRMSRIIDINEWGLFR